MGTETGWITMGEVEVGTVLFDEHGLPTTVTAVYDVWPEQAWRIWFSDGTHVDACGDHLWVTLDTLDRKRINRAGGDIPYDWASKDPITTAEMVSTITRGPRGDRNHCIPVTLPLQTDALSLLVDPWVLGYWLGNGSIRDGTVTVHNEDEAFVRDRMLAGGYRTGARYLYERAATFSAFGLRPNLRAIGVLGDKHVPERYLRASEAQRRALLAGLLDSDGHSALTGQIEFSSKDETLANGVAELARSLGQKPVVVKGTSTLYGVEKGPRYRVRWRPTENLFTSPRKSDSFAPLGSQKMRNHHRMITKAEPIEPRPMRCVTVDSPNSMYLVGEGMIPTHNTRTASEWINERVRNGHGRRIALLGRTAADVRDVMVLGESGIIEISRPGEVPVWEPSKRRVTWPNGAYALCIAEGELVLTSTGPVPIEKLRRGDKVLTRSGYWPVRSAWLTDRDREIVEISTALTTLRCTPDHRVLVGDGRSDTWIQAGHLQPGDMVHFRPAIDGMAVMMPVESVSSAGRARTYDVAVDGHPEFYANGLLVHNCFSADEPDQLRGPQFDTAWCDEFASYPQVSGADGLTAFANLRLGLRLPVDGDMPRMVATTTPRRVPSMFQLLEESENPEFGIVITRGTTYDNLANLAQSFRATILGLYEGTRIGQQELMGEMLHDIEGALFSQSDLDANRVTELPTGIKMHTVIGVDPSVAERPKDEAGIVVIRGTAERDFYRRQLYVVEDATVLGSPAVWAKRVVDMAIKWGGPVVAEGNQGGELVRMAIGQVNANVPVYIVHAKAGKATRAEPVAALAEQGRLHMLNYHPLLESEITSWVPAESKISPGRLDAMVWAALALTTKVKGASFATSTNLRARSMSAHRLPHLGAANLTKRTPMYRGRR